MSNRNEILKKAREKKKQYQNITSALRQKVKYGGLIPVSFIKSNLLLLQKLGIKVDPLTFLVTRFALEFDYPLEFRKVQKRQEDKKQRKLERKMYEDANKLLFQLMEDISYKTDEEYRQKSDLLKALYDTNKMMAESDSDSDEDDDLERIFQWAQQHFNF
jgi:hypothetical protein